MTQKIIQVGNSAAIVIPKEYLETLGVKVGTKVEVSLDPTIKQLVVDLRQKKQHVGKGAKLSREFEQWLQNFLTEDQELLDELAGR